ncbi:MAG: hypothetical protein NC127_02070 [Muribaculum sp.]|nr:hypothetical protein [Muribaculum sp.]
MRLRLFRYIVVLFCAISGLADTKASGLPMQTSELQDSLTAFQRRQLKYEQRWNNLIPKYFKIQYAGGMGLLSFGMGWEYGSHRQWETDLLIGFIPKHSSKRAKTTMSVKQNFVPWNIPLKGRLSVEPLSTGMYLNTVFGSEFWTQNPDKYPQGYYWFSTRVRTHVFIGQRIKFVIPDNRRKYSSSVTAFYELSTCDLYVIQAVRNSYIKPKDYLRLSFGLKFNIF